LISPRNGSDTRSPYSDVAQDGAMRLTTVLGSLWGR
jgi:hypothetical protein